ncbi:hypothetical protein Dsin_003788 [Dipteronia sinensis]|uniref:Uncharacterized protein n=1 Tax=Dipteronia sinensis TaxID=43782 RepID=A0AAE0EL95_9ROSI|nr:hypothetical protein Dsin_003788 [Dipteronia sinensis]
MRLPNASKFQGCTLLNYVLQAMHEKSTAALASTFPEININLAICVLSRITHKPSIISFYKTKSVRASIYLSQDCTANNILYQNKMRKRDVEPYDSTMGVQQIPYQSLAPPILHASLTAPPSSAPAGPSDKLADSVSSFFPRASP